MTLLEQTALAILTQAAQSEHGIVIGVIDPHHEIASPVFRAKQILYRFKQENSDFSNLHIRISPNDPETELWITKQ